MASTASPSLLRPDLTSTVECTDFACRTANSHPETCDCQCGGDGHGSHGWRPIAQRAAENAAGRDPFARLPKVAAGSDDAF